MEIRIEKYDEVHAVSIAGQEIRNVVDYKITTSAKGNAEIVLKIKLSDSVSLICLSES